LVLVLGVGMSGAAPRAGQLKPYRVGFNAWIGSIAFFVAQEKGFFKEAGLEIEVLYTEGGASTMTPVLAGSIAANDPAHGGSSGIYFADLLKRMSLYDEVQPKLFLCKTGRDCALALLRGDAEIGITFTSEFIAVQGTRVVGPLPAEIAYVNGYAGAIPKDAAQEPARAFLTFLASPSSKARFKAYGLE